MVLSLVLAAGIYIDIFFRGKHLVLGGNQSKVTIDVSYIVSKRLLISKRDSETKVVRPFMNLNLFPLNPKTRSVLMRSYKRLIIREIFEHGGRILPPSNIPIDSADGFELIKSNQQTGNRVYFPSNRSRKSNSNALSIHMLIAILGDGAN